MTASNDRGVILRLVDQLNTAHGLRFDLRGRCVNGLQGGAWVLANTTGRLAVFKIRRAEPGLNIERIAEAVARVREAGYPTPAWLASGTSMDGISYWVQDYVTGRPATPLIPSTAERLVAVLECQAELDPLPDRDWGGRIAATALSDDIGSHRRTVRRLGPAGSRLLASYDRLIAEAGQASLPEHDMIHGDFNSCNILLDHGGGISGVIDVQDLGSGSRVVDYACLLREAYVHGYGEDVIRLIRRSGEAVAGWAGLALCAAAAAFFIVTFKLQHEPAAITTVLPRLHQLADDLSKPC